MVHRAKQQKAEQSRRAPAKAHGTQQTQKAAKQKMVHPVKQQKAEQSNRALRKHMVLYVVRSRRRAERQSSV